MGDWGAYTSRLGASVGATVVGSGEGWIAWRSPPGNEGQIDVRSDDGRRVRSLTIRSESVVADMLASAKWVASLSERERERALAAVEALEGANG